MNPNELIEALAIKSWIPRVGDLVRRRDNKVIKGAISGFRVGNLGVMVSTDLGGETTTDTPLGILEPVDITDVIMESSSPVHRALERILENG